MTHASPSTNKKGFADRFSKGLSIAIGAGFVLVSLTGLTAPTASSTADPEPVSLFEIDESHRQPAASRLAPRPDVIRPIVNTISVPADVDWDLSGRPVVSSKPPPPPPPPEPDPEPEVEVEQETVIQQEPAPATATESETHIAPSGAVAVPASESQAIAFDMVVQRGWDGSEFTCLVELWNRESNWNHLAENTSSGAYGIPQALPGNKMESVASDWRTNPVTQITWGLGYIADRYETPCGALQHSYDRGWY